MVCSDAWATDLEYNFSVTDDFANRENCSDQYKPCKIKDLSSTTTSGTINRLTGELSAKQDSGHYDEKASPINEETLHIAWQMKCTKMERSF